MDLDTFPGRGEASPPRGHEHAPSYSGAARRASPRGSRAGSIASGKAAKMSGLSAPSRRSLVRDGGSGAGRPKGSTGSHLGTILEAITGKTRRDASSSTRIPRHKLRSGSHAKSASRLNRHRYHPTLGHNSIHLATRKASSMPSSTRPLRAPSTTSRAENEATPVRRTRSCAQKQPSVRPARTGPSRSTSRALSAIPDTSHQPRATPTVPSEMDFDRMRSETPSVRRSPRAVPIPRTQTWSKRLKSQLTIRASTFPQVAAPPPHGAFSKRRAAKFKKRLVETLLQDPSPRVVDMESRGQSRGRSSAPSEKALVRIPPREPSHLAVDTRPSRSRSRSNSPSEPSRSRPLSVISIGTTIDLSPQISGALGLEQEEVEEVQDNLHWEVSVESQELQQNLWED